MTGSTQVQEIRALNFSLALTLRESMADLVEANPYADTVNAVENSARALAERFQLEGFEWVRVRKAGRRVFVMVSFFEHPGKSLEGMDVARQAVAEEMMLLHPDVDVAVLFRSVPAKSPPRPLAATIQGKARPDRRKYHLTCLHCKCTVSIT